eukprot:2527652-Rhodomonas_salina.1
MSQAHCPWSRARCPGGHGHTALGVTGALRRVTGTQAHVQASLSPSLRVWSVLARVAPFSASLALLQALLLSY